VKTGSICDSRQTTATAETVLAVKKLDVALGDVVEIAGRPTTSCRTRWAA